MGKFAFPIYQFIQFTSFFSFSYSGGPSAKSEVKTLDGVTRGSYSYIDAESKLQTVNYVADHLGFRVAATNLPTPPVDTNSAPVASPAQAPTPVEETPEVKKARAEHLAAVAQARSESSEPEAEELVAPEPVEDTEEVKQARSEHLQAVEEAKARLSSPIVATSAVHLAHVPLTIVRSDPSASFAYSVLAPNLIAV